MSELRAVVSQLNTTNENLETVKDSLTSLVVSMSAFMDKITDSFEDVMSSVKSLNLSTPPLEKLDLEAETTDLETPKSEVTSLSTENNSETTNISSSVNETSSDVTNISSSNVIVQDTDGADGDGDDDDDAQRPIIIEDGETDSEDEERRREEGSIFSAIQNALDGLGKGLEDLGNSVANVFESAFGAAAVGSLLLLFVDPELAIDLLGSAIDTFVDAIEAVTGLLNGDISALGDFIANNPITSVVLGTFLLFKTIAAVGAAITTLTGAWASIAGLFAEGAIFGSGGAFASLAGKLSAIGLGPLLAIAAGIAAVIYSLTKAFGDALNVFKESGSFVSALKEFVVSFLANLISIPIRLAKWLAVNLLEFFGFEKLAAALDSIDILGPFKNAIGLVLDVLSGIAGLIISPFKLIFDVVSGVFSGILDVIRGIASVIEGIFTGDLGQVVNGIKEIFGGAIDILLTPFRAIGDFLKSIANKILNLISKVPGASFFLKDVKKEAEALGGEADSAQEDIDNKKKILEEQKGLTDQEKAIIEQQIAEKEKEKQLLLAKKEKLSEDQKNLEYAEDSGLFEKNFIGESEVDMEKIATARTEQLEAILELEGDDISDEAKAAIEKQILKNKGFEFETTENVFGGEVESISQESLQKASTESINEMLSMSEGALNDFTRMKLEEELAVREVQKESGEKRGMEIPTQGDAVTVQDPLMSELQKISEQDSRSESTSVTEKRGMEIPTQGDAVTVQDPLIGELKKQIERDMAREAAFAEMREKAEKEKSVIDEKSSENIDNKFERFIGSDIIDNATATAQAPAKATAGFFMDNVEVDDDFSETELNTIDSSASFLGDQTSSLSMQSSTDTQEKSNISNVIAAMGPVFGPIGPMLANVLESAVSSEKFGSVLEMVKGPLGPIKDMVSNFFMPSRQDPIKSAEQSGLFEKRLLGESVVNMEKISEASNEQLQAILALEGDDISSDSKSAIETELQNRKESELIQEIPGIFMDNAEVYDDFGVETIAPLENSLVTQDNDIMTKSGILENSSITNIMKAIMGPVFGPMGPMMADTLGSIVSSEKFGSVLETVKSPLSSIGNAVSSFFDFGGDDSATQNINQKITDVLSESGVQQSTIESMDYVSDLRNAQVENNELASQAENSNVAMMSSVANNTRATTNNNNTTVINNNGPAIDEITKAFAFNPSY